MNKFLRTILALIIAVVALDAAAFEVNVRIDNRDYATLTAADGTVFALKDGDNTLQMTDAHNPVVLAKTPTGKLLEVIYNGDWRFPAAGPHSFNFADGDRLVVYTDEDAGTVTLAVNGDAAAAELRVDGTPQQIGLITVPIDARIDISQRPGYIIDEVSLSPAATVTREGDTWSFTASRNHNVDIKSHPDVAENVKINVDNATNMTVRDALGTALALTDGDNLLSLDPATQSPLTVVANPGAEMVMAVANGEMLFPDNDGVYTLPLKADGFNEIWLISQRNQANTITVNVDKAERVVMSDARGPIELKDGSNFVVFDFDNGNPVTVEAAPGATLRGVAVDGTVFDVTPGRVTFSVTRGSVVDISTGGSDAETGWIVLVDEDFSGLTAGTPDAPATDVQLFDAFGFALPDSGLKPYHESCTSTWGGDRLYPAGGTLAVMGGFLNTPVGDYSGDLKLTFRARLVPDTGVSRHGLDVMLIRHSRLDEFKRATYTLTTEWQEFSFTADNGWFYDTKIQFFTLDDLCYEIDDVHIEHRINGIEPPTAQLADELTNDSFVATWYSTDTAEDYLLSVYEHGPVTDTVDMTEDFESASVADGHVTSLPQGWEFNLSAAGDRCEISDGAAFASSGSRAICFDAGGDYLITPVADAGIIEFSFHLAADTSDPGYDPNLGQVVAVGALTDTGWSEWINVSVPALIQQYGGATTVDLTENLGLFDNIYAFRLEAVMHENDRVMVYIDDVHYTVTGTPQPIYLFEDLVVEGQETTSYLVAGDDFDPDADYFYTVKARNSRYTSAPSNEIEVFNIHIPEALEATDVTDSSFTAAWECGAKADSYVVTLYHTLTAQTDDEAYVVLAEDFSKATGTGTPLAPDGGTPAGAYVSIDHLTNMPGWKATSHTTLNGMVGGMAENPDVSGQLAGAIMTPVMDLSNNGGLCHVKVHGWFHAGDGLVIQGTNAATFAAVPTSVDGEYEIEVDLALCSNQETLVFYSGTYKDFMIDDITITQKLKAGDKVKIRTRETAVADKDARSLAVTGIGQYADHALSYDVYAKRAYHQNPDEVYSSLRSAEVAVALEPAALDAVAAESAVSIAAGTGHILVTTPAAAAVAVYTTDGITVLSTAVPAGTTRIELPAGVYVVTAGTTTSKTLVK